jgi:uridylate kinase
MDADPAPQRVLLKVSGNAFGGSDGPFDEDNVAFLAREISRAAAEGTQIAVVSGAGNILRGATLRTAGPARVRADYAGMMATLVNVLVLRDHLERLDAPVSHYCALPVQRTAPVFDPEAAIADMEAGKVVLLAGGTGNPLLTTDTAAALRAAERAAGCVLKATRVDGVYSADPEKHPDAERFERLTYREVLERELGVMDLTAVGFCMTHNLPLHVFDYSVEGNISRAARGEVVGTIIGSDNNAS